PAHLPENAPAWVCAALKAGWPVVVRRAPADPAPGCARRWPPARDLPAWRALRDLRAPLNALGLAWGVTGRGGF
ncbi:malonate decarboxylase holo-ACP synthase, partial [Pseudomonas aeruginosa]